VEGIRLYKPCPLYVTFSFKERGTTPVREVLIEQIVTPSKVTHTAATQQKFKLHL
jgi:hypothetical protein